MRIAMITLLLAVLCQQIPLSAQAPFLGGFPFQPGPPVGAQVGSLVINTAKSKLLGTAFCVSKEGYIATSFNNVRNALSATLVSANGVTVEVTGAVAVNKARDLVILATAVNQVIPNLPFDPKADPVLQSILMPQAGPLSKPFAQLVPRSQLGLPYYPHLQGKATGEEFLRGLKNDGIIGLGTDLAMEWQILDVPMDATYTGAPVWNETYTSVVGIVSSANDGTPGVRYVLPIRYVLDLTPQNPVALIPLAKLAKWEDPKQLPPAADAVKLAAVSSADRMETNTGSRDKLETDITTLKQLKVKFTADANAAEKNIKAAQYQLNKMRPEEKTLVKKSSSRSSKDKKGKEDRDEYEYEYSPRQERERSSLSSTISNGYSSILVSTLHSGLIENNLLPHTQRRLGETTIELFLTADPLELRSLNEIKPLQTRLDEKIQQGSKDPMDYLLRAVLLTRQKNGAAARLALAEMVKLNLQYTPMKVVLERRLENFENNTKLTAPQQTHKSPLNELLVPLVAARIEWDLEDGFSANKILTRWLVNHQRHADVHTAVAWEMLETQPITVINNRLALQYAWDAVELSRGGDWHALGSLAAAQMRNKDFLNAQATVTFLAPLMPADQSALRDAWQKAVLDKEPLVWKR